MNFVQGSFTVDGAAVASMEFSDAAGNAWQVTTLGAVTNNGRLNAWGVKAVVSPAVGEFFAGTLSDPTVVSKGAALPLTADMPLDGSATLSLVYR